MRGGVYEAYPIAVFFTKQGHRTPVEGLLVGHFLPFNWLVITHPSIDAALDVSQLLGRHRPVVRKVKTQAQIIMRT